MRSVQPSHPRAWWWAVFSPEINTEAQWVALKNELLTDPRAYGYNAAAADHTGMAEKLMLPRTAANSGTGVALTVRRGIRSGIAVMNAIVLAAYDALTVPRQQYIIALVTPVEGVDLANDQVRTNLGAIFPTGVTRTALLAAADKTPASRLEELFGVDSYATGDTCLQALTYH